MFITILITTFAIISIAEIVTDTNSDDINIDTDIESSNQSYIVDHTNSDTSDDDEHKANGIYCCLLNKNFEDDDAIHIVIAESITIQAVMFRSQTVAATMHDAMSNDIASATLKDRSISFLRSVNKDDKNNCDDELVTESSITILLVITFR